MIEQSIQIKYTNWQGKTEERKIIPRKLFFGTSPWHKEPQWLLVAYCLERMAERTFAMREME